MSLREKKRKKRDKNEGILHALDACILSFFHGVRKKKVKVKKEQNKKKRKIRNRNLSLLRGEEKEEKKELIEYRT